MLLANSKYRHTSADFRYLCRSCFLNLWFDLLIFLLNSSLRDYLICTSREEELRFNLENFWINKELRWKLDVFMKFSKNQTWITMNHVQRQNLKPLPQLSKIEFSLIFIPENHISIFAEEYQDSVTILPFYHPYVILIHFVCKQIYFHKF